MVCDNYIKCVSAIQVIENDDKRSTEIKAYGEIADIIATNQNQQITNITAHQNLRVPSADPVSQDLSNHFADDDETYDRIDETLFDQNTVYENHEQAQNGYYQIINTDMTENDPKFQDKQHGENELNGYQVDVRESGDTDHIYIDFEEPVKQSSRL